MKKKVVHKKKISRSGLSDFKRWKSTSLEEFRKEFFNKSFFSLFEMIILIIIAILFGIFVGYILTLHKNPLDKNVSEIIDTYYQLSDSYYKDLDSEDLSNAAIKGMIDSLKDPYSSYMNQETTDNMQESIDGYFIGIGVTVQYEESGYHRVIDVLSDGPAKKAGIVVDDVITELNGNSVLDMSVDEFIKQVRGKRGTHLDITVQRGEEELSFDVIRDVVEIKSVSHFVFNQDNAKIGYIRIDSFASNTYPQFSKSLKKLEKQNINSLIIDVRDNPGGYLLSTQEILSMFFPKKTVLYQIESKNVKRKVTSISKESRNYPIVVLVNAGSASASEVLASSIQENYHKSLIVGTTTYGKGTVQKEQSFSDGTSIKYTSEKWLTSSGKWLNEKGVTPDIYIEQSSSYYENPIYSTDVQLQEAIKQIKSLN